MIKKPARVGMPYADAPIATYLTKMIEISPLSQREIANAIGYEKPTMISMFKRGETKVPLDKIPALAKVLNIDPGFLFRLALQQYWPEDQQIIAEIFGDVTSRHERELLALWREVVKDSDPKPDRKIKACFKDWATGST